MTMSTMRALLSTSFLIMAAGIACGDDASIGTSESPSTTSSLCAAAERMRLAGGQGSRHFDVRVTTTAPLGADVSVTGTIDPCEQIHFGPMVVECGGFDLTLEADPDAEFDVHDEVEAAPGCEHPWSMAPPIVTRLGCRGPSPDTVVCYPFDLPAVDGIAGMLVSRPVEQVDGPGTDVRAIVRRVTSTDGRLAP